MVYLAASVLWTPQRRCIGYDAVALRSLFNSTKAAINKAELCCAKLLAAGANPNALNQGKHTPLHVACLIQSVPVARLLLEKGSKPELKDADGDTALAIAELKKNAELIQLLKHVG